MDINSKEYKILKEAASKHNMSVEKFAKTIIMEDYDNAGYSGNDSWFEQFPEDQFIEIMCRDLDIYMENYPEYF